MEDMDLDVTQELEEATSDQGQEQSTSTTQDGGDRQSTGGKKVNWQDDPEYRKQQAERDRRLAMLENAYRESEQRRQQVEQRQFQEYLATLPDVERERVLRQHAEQGMAQARRQLELERMAIQREADIVDVCSEFEISRAELDAALPESFDNHVLWKTARSIAKQKEAKTKTRKPTAQDVATENVDVGAGKTVGKQEYYQRQLDAARKAKNADKILDIRTSARREGITLK